MNIFDIADTNNVDFHVDYNRVPSSELLIYEVIAQLKARSRSSFHAPDPESSIKRFLKGTNIDMSVHHCQLCDSSAAIYADTMAGFSKSYIGPSHHLRWTATIRYVHTGENFQGFTIRRSTRYPYVCLTLLKAVYSKLPCR